MRRRSPMWRRKLSEISMARRAVMPLMRLSLSGWEERTSAVSRPKRSTRRRAVAGPRPRQTPEPR